MLTKAIYAIVLTGALYVSGDATFRSVSCCNSGPSCGTRPRACCFGATQPKTDDNGSTGSDCCSPPRAVALTAAKTEASDCCSSELECCSGAKTVATKTVRAAQK